MPRARTLGNFGRLRAHPARCRPPRTRALSKPCANCGTVAEADALFCARCGLNFSTEFKGTPIEALGDVSPVLLRLREHLGDRYAIERELGKGGMATVYLARDLKHDREVAIKVLHPDLAASIGGERFEREIRLAAKLQHPHILGLYDSGTADGLLYYVMPFVKGESLRDRLDREGMLPIDDAIAIAVQVAQALGYAHEQGIVHRDIKPENVLLSGGHLLVADFGIARAASEVGERKLTQTGMSLGTPVYMAPEQSTGDPVGPTADLYSLGCMLYEMLAGEPPFNGPNAMAIMAKHLMEQVPSVRVVRQAVPEEIEQAIFITLNKQAIDRPQSATQFIELLGMPVGMTGTMRAVRGSQMMRGSQVMRGSVAVPRAGSQYQMEAIPEGMYLPPVPVWKRPATWVGAAAAAAAGVGVWFALSGGRGPVVADPNANRVAVLYFDDASRDSSLRLVADGLTEGVIRSLGKVSSLEVISRGGVEPYRGAAVAPDSIARALRAGFLVRGEVAPEQAQVRVSLALLDKAGTSVDRASLTVPRDSVLLLQDSIAGLAAELLARPLGRELQLAKQRSATTSNQAWLLVQEGTQRLRQAQALQAQRDTAAGAAWAAADSVYALAERLDAKWAEPVARRARLAYLRSRVRGIPPQQIREHVAAAIGHAERALGLDPENADALEWRGTARYWSVLATLSLDPQQRLRDLRAAQADLERATQLNPRQATAFATLSHMYYRIPDKTVDNVLVAAMSALSADEFQENVGLVRQRLFFAAFDLGRFDQAEGYCAELERRSPGIPVTIRCRLHLQSIPTVDSVDLVRTRRLADSLHLVSGGDTVSLLMGNMWYAAGLARASVKAPVGSARATMLADSARIISRQSLGDATIESARDLALHGAYVSAVLGDKEEAFRRLTAYIAVEPETRGVNYEADPTWMFRSLEAVDRAGWARVVRTGR